MKIYKKIMSAVFLVNALCYTGFVSAHTAEGVLGKASSGAAATEVWQVDCGVSAAKVFLQVIDRAPINSSLVSVLAVKGQSASILSTDTNDGDGVASPGVTFKPKNGSGVYTLIVSKSASATKGIERYQATIHCLDAKGKHIDKEEPIQVQFQ